MEYWPESPHWAGVAKHLEEYLCEQNKTAKYHREKEKYRCTRPHVDELPPRPNRESSNEHFHTPPQWPRQQAAWAGPRHPPLQQDWPQDRTPGRSPYHQGPQNHNHDPRYPEEDLEDDAMDEDYQAQRYDQSRNVNPPNRRRATFRGSGRSRHRQDESRVVYDSDERFQGPHRPERAGQGFDPDSAYTRPRPSKGRYQPHERQYESDPEGNYGRDPHGERWAGEGFEDRPQSRSRRREDGEGEEGGVTDGA
ncbi:hypothetical protein MMC11_008837 [Xylographa trunciseda]|nr:hypothetical protein [Xylographa trunciseda]